MKTLHLSIILGIVVGIAALVYVSAYWYENRHGTPIPSNFGDVYQTYVMRYNPSPGEYISFEYISPPIGNQEIRIEDPNDWTFNDCVVYQNNDTNRVVIKNFQKIEQNFESILILNDTRQVQVQTLHFSCKNPEFDISWPNLVLDKKDYQHGDSITLNGHLMASSNVQVLVYEPVGTANLLRNIATNPIASQNISTDPEGNFSFSYSIPIDEANGKWIIGIKSGYDEYYFMFRVNMEQGTF
ncbi:MAG: hypothetical protein KGL95_08870 [Patescibacteria group bacterium]|nr:hypothetical protein [Patescibacteria group bacterium]